MGDGVESLSVVICTVIGLGLLLAVLKTTLVVDERTLIYERALEGT